MISIGEATFHMEIAHIDDAALEKYATVLFEGFDEAAAILPLPDSLVILSKA